MNYELLSESLNHPNVQTRQMAVLILGMVDEVRAITALRKRYARESNRNVKQAMQTVGGQLARIQREGHDTIQALCEHFGVFDETPSQQPVLPGNDDIRPLLTRIQTISDSEERCIIVQQIVAANNPAALPFLAELHWHDDDPQVQAVAKTQGRLLYWQGLYWQMAQDGSIDDLRRQYGVQPDMTLPDGD